MLARKQSILLQRLVEYSYRPPKSGEEATHMIVEEPNSPQEQSPSQIIEGVLGSPEVERSEVTVVPLEPEEVI